MRSRKFWMASGILIYIMASGLFRFFDLWVSGYLLAVFAVYGGYNVTVNRDGIRADKKK